MSKSKRTCVFCGSDDKLEQEHLIPEWIGRLLPDHGQGTHVRTRGVGSTPTSWKGKAYSRTAGVVCHDCNGGWMSDQETRIRPLLRPILLGYAASFKPKEARQIAKWAFTRALVGAARLPDIPREPYDFINANRANHKLPKHTKVWFGAFAPGPHQTYHTVVPLRIGSEPVKREGGNGHMTNFSAGHAVFHVFGNHSGRPSPHGFRGQLGRTWAQIWPAHHPVTWPPRLFLDERLLDTITETYGPLLS